jgi:hypothetical protein
MNSACSKRTNLATAEQKDLFQVRTKRLADPPITNDALRSLESRANAVVVEMQNTGALATLRANISETLSVTIINEQGEEEKIRDEQEVS